MSALVSVFSRDVELAFRAGGGAAQGAVFFGLVTVMFVFGTGPEPGALARVAAPILWTGALLASLLSLDRVFQADFEDGSLDILVQRTETLEFLVLAKAFAHWVGAVLPLLVITPVLAAMLNVEAMWPLLASLLVGSPALSLIGAIGAALTFPLRRANVLVTILIGPLFAPVVIFGTGAAADGALGAGFGAPPLMLLAAVSLFSLIVAPLAGAAAIRFNLQ